MSADAASAAEEFPSNVTEVPASASMGLARDCRETKPGPARDVMKYISMAQPTALRYSETYLMVEKMVIAEMGEKIAESTCKLCKNSIKRLVDVNRCSISKALYRVKMKSTPNIPWAF